MTDTQPTSAAGAMRALLRRLGKARIEQGISMTEMARRVGVTRQSLTAWEDGKTWPNVDHLFRWAKLLGFWVVLEPIGDAGLEVEPRLAQGGGLLEFFSNHQPERKSGEAILDALVPAADAPQIADRWSVTEITITADEAAGIGPEPHQPDIYAHPTTGDLHRERGPLRAPRKPRNPK